MCFEVYCCASAYSEKFSYVKHHTCVVPQSLHELSLNHAGLQTVK